MNFSNIKSLTILEGNVTKISHGNVVLWQKITSRIPDEYQEVEYVNRPPTLDKHYIDLGFAFDTGATIYIGYKKNSGNPQLFGAAENSGKHRCMLTDSGSVTIYGSNGSNYIGNTIATNTVRRDLKCTLKQGSLLIEDLISGVSSDSLKTQVAYTMTSNLALFAQHYNGTYRTTGDFNIYSFKYYDKTDNLVCDLVPCYRKSDGEIGMYDIVRKIFLTNGGAGKLVKGADV